MIMQSQNHHEFDITMRKKSGFQQSLISNNNVQIS
jgi:hypothetical protein